MTDFEHRSAGRVLPIWWLCSGGLGEVEHPGEHQEVETAWQVGQIVRLHLTRVADFLFPQDTFAEELVYSGYLNVY